MRRAEMYLKSMSGHPGHVRAAWECCQHSQCGHAVRARTLRHEHPAHDDHLCGRRQPACSQREACGHFAPLVHGHRPRLGEALQPAHAPRLRPLARLGAATCSACRRYEK